MGHQHISEFWVSDVSQGSLTRTNRKQSLLNPDQTIFIITGISQKF